MPKTDGTTISTSLASGFCTLATKREQDSETQSERERERHERRSYARNHEWRPPRALSLSAAAVDVCESASACVCV